MIVSFRAMQDEGGSRARTSHRPIGINLTESSSTPVGAREVRSGGEGLYGRPVPGV